MDVDDLPDLDGPDRDTWATPEWLTSAIGHVDLDPCSNERSTVLAKRRFDLNARGENGLVLAKFVAKSTRTYVNPPYSRGMVVQFIKAYRHTNFTFCLRYDFTTEWFRELWGWCEALCFPYDRVDFVPPPGANDAGSIYYPHCLYYRRAIDVSPEVHRLCYVVRPVTRQLPQSKDPR